MRRFRGIMDSSQNADACDALHRTERLDELVTNNKKHFPQVTFPISLHLTQFIQEKGLYEHGQRSMKLNENWAKRRTGKIQTSSMVERHRKRKADLME